MIPVQVVGLGMSPGGSDPQGPGRSSGRPRCWWGGGGCWITFRSIRAMKIPLGKDPEGTLNQLRGPGRSQAGGGAGLRGPQFLRHRTPGGEGPGGGAGGDPPQPHRGAGRLRPPEDALAGRHHHQPARAHLGAIWPRPWASRAPCSSIRTRRTPPGKLPGSSWPGAWLRSASACWKTWARTTERVTWLTLAEAREQEFSPLNLVVMLREPGEAEPAGPGASSGAPGSGPGPPGRAHHQGRGAGRGPGQTGAADPARSSGTWGPGAAPWGWRPACSSPAARFLRWSATRSGPPRSPPTGTVTGWTT